LFSTKQILLKKDQEGGSQMTALQACRRDLQDTHQTLKKSQELLAMMQKQVRDSSQAPHALSPWQVQQQHLEEDEQQQQNRLEFSQALSNIANATSPTETTQDPLAKMKHQHMQTAAADVAVRQQQGRLRQITFEVLTEVS